MPETLLTFTLYSADQAPIQLAGPAMVKATSDVQLSRVTGCFCRWAGLPVDSVEFYFNRQPLAHNLSLQQSGLVSGNAIDARLTVTGLTPDPKAAAAPFAMLDVLESELLDLGGLSTR